MRVVHSASRHRKISYDLDAKAAGLRRSERRENIERVAPSRPVAGSTIIENRLVHRRAAEAVWRHLSMVALPAAAMTGPLGGIGCRK